MIPVIPAGPGLYAPFSHTGTPDSATVTAVMPNVGTTTSATDPTADKTSNKGALKRECVNGHYIQGVKHTMHLFVHETLAHTPDHVLT